MNNLESTIDRLSKEFFSSPKHGIPAAGTYLAALLVSILIVTPLFTGSGDKWLVWFFLAGLVGLVLLRLWMVAAIFLLVQMKLGFSEPTRYVSQLTGGELMFGIGVLVMLIAGSRLVSLTSPMVAPDSTMFGVIRTVIRRIRSDHSEEQHAVMPTRLGNAFSAMEGLTGLVRAIVCVLAAAFLLSLLPLDPSTRDEVLLFEWAVRPITLGVILIIVYQLTQAILGTLGWGCLSRSEASVYIRSELMDWPHRDIRGVVKRQVRERRNRRRS